MKQVMKQWKKTDCLKKKKKNRKDEKKNELRNYKENVMKYLENRNQSFYASLNGQELMKILNGEIFIKMKEL
jgi:DNA topoisomerase IB